MTSLVARLKNAFAKSRFANPESAARHVSLIAGGTIIAQAVGILTIPIVSRIYSPADYGIMAVYASVIAILGELSGFRYHLAIPLPQAERYAKALVALSLGLQIVFVALLALLLFFAGEYLLTMLSMPELIPYRALIPLGLLATGTFMVLTQWAIREKLFSTIARTKITQSLSGAVAKIGLGLLGVRPLGLLIGTIVAQGGGITTLLRSLLKKKGVPRPAREDVRRAALRYRKFPMYSTWSGLLNTLGRQIVPILLIAFYDTNIVGLFALSMHMLQLPVSFIGQAIAQVFIQKASVAKRQGSLPQLTVRTFEFLLHISALPMLTIAILAPDLFAFLLGERWRMAGLFSQLLAPWIFFMFLLSPITGLFSVLEKQYQDLLFNLVNIAGRIGSIFLGYYLFENPTYSVFFYGLFSVLFVLAIIFWLFKTASIPRAAITLLISNFAIRLLPFALAIATILLTLPRNFFTLILATALIFIHFLVHLKTLKTR